MTAATTAGMRKEWGAVLRRERERRALTQAALAELTGLDQASVSRVEAGAGSFESTLRCAQVLEVELGARP